MEDWLHCDAIKIKNGRIYLKNPSVTYNNKADKKASLMDKLFGVRVTKYKVGPKEIQRARVDRLVRRTKAPIKKNKELSAKDVKRLFGDLN